MLGATLATVLPLIRRRQALVDIREAASNTLAGHLADSISNAEVGARVRARARRGAHSRSERQATTARRRCVRGTTRTSASTWSRRRCSSATNILGLVAALATRGSERREPGAVFITFSYYSTATRVMWEFNRIYRNLEGAITDAAQFAELLLDPPVGDRCGGEPSRSRRPTTASSCASVSFRYTADAAAAVRRPVAHDPAGAKFGLVGPLRRRQDDADAAAAAILGRRGRARSSSAA